MLRVKGKQGRRIVIRQFVYLFKASQYNSLGILVGTVNYGDGIGNGSDVSQQKLFH